MTKQISSRVILFSVILIICTSLTGCIELDTTAEKTEPSKVGDIVFNDGSAIAWNKNLILTDEQKANAVAVIFYAGDETGPLGKHILGVGLANTQGEEIQMVTWTSKKCPGGLMNFKDTQCSTTTDIPSETDSYYEYTRGKTRHYVTGDIDGSDNWDVICNTDSKAENTAMSNYPAFYWANNYGKKYLLDGDMANGWYLPSVAELLYLHKYLSIVNNALESVGGTPINNAQLMSSYWSSNQATASTTKDISDSEALSLNSKVWLVEFANGQCYTDYKSGYNSACAIRDFS